jgi:hypothetical protein
MAMELWGDALDGVTAISFGGVISGSAVFTVIDAAHIVFTAPAGPIGQVHLVAHGAAGSGSATLWDAFEIISTTGMAVDLSSGAVVTVAEDVRLIVPQGDAAATVPVTCTVVDPVADAPGVALLESFVVQTGGDAIGGVDWAPPMIVEVTVAAHETVDGATPLLFHFDESSQTWIPASNQAYSVADGRLHAALPGPGRYVVVLLEWRPLWFPLFNDGG